MYGVQPNTKLKIQQSPRPSITGTGKGTGGAIGMRSTAMCNRAAALLTDH